ncbi:MAG: hypothetical protein CMN87_12170 [Stappia sp.]|uniref:helix-turn-helix domain-containing protein n=1 Tax=Stappia sp. TaxID=1870903 RepID=UPI000C5380A4|nr:helix-turn-helix domain-containing protein [Stappia sp.]MAB00118.1 hypothetical protein [Stappia sp.]MBM20757.1 hypothetical protein [Stappia sp.]
MSGAGAQAVAGGPRYSIIPAAAVTDPRFQGRDLQILGLIGRHTDRNGWCRLNQGKLAGAINVSRPTVSRSIARLVEWGYLETRTHWRADGGRAASSYRVRMDVDDALAAPELDIEDDPDGGDDAAFEGGEALDVVGTPVHLVNRPLYTQDEHPPVHSGCTALTTPLTNDQKKAQRQKKAEAPHDPEAPHVPTDDHPGDGTGREAHDEGAVTVAHAGDARPEGVSAADAGAPHDDHGPDDASDGGSGDGPDRSAAARKAHETRMLNDLLREFPGAVTERRPPIDAAWAALSADDKRSSHRRLDVYLRRVRAAKRKPGRLLKYLRDAPFRVLPDPVERAARDEPKPRLLDRAVVEQFLRSVAAREVLARAHADGLVIKLAGHVRETHALPDLEGYAAMRDEWLQSVAAMRERAAGDDLVQSAARSGALVWVGFHEEWQRFAADVLGPQARDGPDAGEASGEARRQAVR